MWGREGEGVRAAGAAAALGCCQLRSRLPPPPGGPGPRALSPPRRGPGWPWRRLPRRCEHPGARASMAEGGSRPWAAAAVRGAARNWVWRPESRRPPVPTAVRYAETKAPQRRLRWGRLPPKPWALRSLSLASCAALGGNEWKRVEFQK